MRDKNSYGGRKSVDILSILYYNILRAKENRTWRTYDEEDKLTKSLLGVHSVGCGRVDVVVFTDFFQHEDC